MLKRLEKWADENHMKLNKENVNSCSWDGLSAYNTTSRVPIQNCVVLGFSLQAT